MALTERQIVEGFWWRDRAGNWPPKSITYFEDYIPGERLNLNITQLDVSDYQQRKIVDRWCQKLPGLSEVNFLWFSSRVSQKMFEAACQMPNLVGLNIKWSGIKTLDSLKLLKSLRHLSLGSSSQVESIEPLGELTNLVTLELEQLNKIKDFSLISRLDQLEGLGIDGSIWTTQIIETLTPLENLHSLKYLTLTNAKVLDQSLDPLLGLTKLVRFNCALNLPKAEFEKLKSLPQLKFGNVAASWEEINK
jgi:Leucine-rich repeat (LRR) protein